ncbi:hypothetical protein [Aureimonas sp. D3]|uniref:hypothetical protein n=1 Tax=Aureimonas sp. D3 TaxID=1638164 RepID=UPI000782EF01|nr:hypothetical protein [Aureimonas sp. D3]
MDIEAIASDRAAIEQGAWVDGIPEMGELRLKVRGQTNPDFQRMMQRLTAAVPRSKRDGGRIDPVEMDRIIGTTLHATVLLDWEGVKVGGEMRPYDRALAFRLCTEPRYLRFRQAVAWAAGEVDDLNAEAEKADAGN